MEGSIMRKRARKNLAGFTFIELAIVLCFLGTIAVIAIPVIYAYKQRGELYQRDADAKRREAEAAQWEAHARQQPLPIGTRILVADTDRPVAVRNEGGVMSAAGTVIPNDASCRLRQDMGIRVIGSQGGQTLAKVEDDVDAIRAAGDGSSCPVGTLCFLPNETLHDYRAFTVARDAQKAKARREAEGRNAAARELVEEFERQHR
jgi:type II secretory pathway pseudopilin PulG